MYKYIVSGSRNSYENEEPTASYNEEDIMKKLQDIKLVLDPVTGEAKYLKELNSLGNRKHTKQAPCPVDKKSSKSNDNVHKRVEFSVLNLYFTKRSVLIKII